MHVIGTWIPVDNNRNNANNARSTFPWLVRLKNIGARLQITHVNAERNHKLKSSKTSIEACGDKIVKKTR